MAQLQPLLLSHPHTACHESTTSQHLHNYFVSQLLALTVPHSAPLALDTANGQQVHVSSAEQILDRLLHLDR